MIEGLGKIGKDAACNTLITEIDDEDPEIRAAVAKDAAMRYPINDFEARYLRAKALYHR